MYELISSELSDAHLTETIDPRIRTKPRMCSSLLQDRMRQVAESERHRDVLERVLKEATA